MQFICWNLQVNSNKSIDDNAADKIAAVVRPFTYGDFALFVLENKKNGDDVASRIASAIGPGCQWRVVFAGGNPSRRESVLMIYSAGVKLTRSERLAGWRDRFDTLLAQEKTRVSARAAQQGEDARALHDLRFAPYEPTFSAVASPDLRDPVLFVLNVGGHEHKVAVVHAPGPGARIEHFAEPEAAQYFAAIMPALAESEAQVVIGDFNLYRIDAAPPGFEEVGTGARATTYGTGKLDRMFVRAGMRSYGSVHGSDQRPSYTDHRPIGLHLPAPDRWSSPLSTLQCAQCGKVHGAMISLVNHWHRCTHCTALYCDACGKAMQRPGGAWFGRTRQCKRCMGTTELVG